MHRILIGLALALVVLPVAAAGPFDGSWQGSVRSASASGRGEVPCAPFQGTMAMVIQNGTVTSGHAVTPKGTPPVQGTVADDGTFTGTSANYALTGKFTGDTFAGQWALGGVCSASVNMTRAH